MNSLVTRIVIVILSMAVSVAPAASAAPSDELSLVVTIVTGERGKDSHSTTTTLTLTGEKLTYQQSYRGAHSGGRPPVKKDYKLTTADRDELTRILREKKLLITRTLAALSQEDEAGSYFSLLLRSKLNGEEQSITIKLPRTAAKLKGDRLYQDSVFLVEQLYRAIKRTDPDISMPQLLY